LTEWAEVTRNPFRVLVSMTYHPDELLRWRAIEATGWIAGAVSDLDYVRDMLRRLFWQMNDESGGLNWHSSELIGEILVNVPVLIGEYADLLQGFLKEEPFERGTHIAVYRAAQMNSGAFDSVASELVLSTSDPDPAIRAFAASTLVVLKKSDFAHVLQPLLEDDSELQYYDFGSGAVVTATVGTVVRSAVDMISSEGCAA
jgi:methylated-DNA-[protein]-cysteine S-methyltransferase